jgi:myo-inositol 2-dehydrogenase/D-chiro-inositol 1-dehydrogenase
MRASNPVLHYFIERYIEAYRAELDSFIDSVEKVHRPPAIRADRREALRLADAALESQKTGRGVRL